MTRDGNNLPVLPGNSRRERKRDRQTERQTDSGVGWKRVDLETVVSRGSTLLVVPCGGKIQEPQHSSGAQEKLCYTWLWLVPGLPGKAPGRESSGNILQDLQSTCKQSRQPGWKASPISSLPFHILPPGQWISQPSHKNLGTHGTNADRRAKTLPCTFEL